MTPFPYRRSDYHFPRTSREAFGFAPQGAFDDKDEETSRVAKFWLIIAFVIFVFFITGFAVH